MVITLETIQSYLGTRFYTRALTYYRQGRVYDLSVEETDEGEVVRAKVEGAFTYDVTLINSMFKKGLKAACSCPAFGDYGRCKHLGATLIAYYHAQKRNARLSSLATLQNAPDRLKESAGARRLIDEYARRASGNNGGNVRLTPKLLFDSGAFHISLMIGDKKLYVVKDIMELARLVENGERCSYGKNLEFTHTPGAFDEQSRKLLAFVCAQVNAVKQYFMLWGSYHASIPALRELRLAGASLDALFDLYEGGEISDRVSDGNYTFITGDPDLSVAADSRDELVELTVSPAATPIEGSAHAYCLVERALYRVSDEFAKSMFPLIRAAGSGKKPMLLTPKDAVDFCSQVLPAINGRARIDDKRGALKAHMPDPMEARYYLDMPERGRLTAKIQFMYESATYIDEMGVERAPNPRRDAARERAAAQALEIYFKPPASAGTPFELADDEEKLYAFLSEGIDKLSESGEVYVSDKLKNINMKRMGQVSVGVSAAQSVLKLDVDTGEFPIEELEALIEAVRAKRRYYRLKDGRFLTLNSGEPDKLAQMADGLNLTGAEFMKGEIELPMSRALYLDNALKQEGELTFNRDAGFRKLARDFRTVDDSDFQPPAELESVLRNYQKTGFRWLKTLDAYRFGGILADDMGLGKTVQVLAYLLSVKRERQAAGERARVSLIICPASLIINWGEEVKKFTPELKARLLCGAAAERALTLKRANDFDLIVTSYDLMRRDAALHAEVDYYACILDEAQYVKNHATKGYHAVRSLKSQTRFALTGTPVQNRLSELWSIFDFLMPGYLYKYAQFKQKLEQPIAKNGDESAKETLKKLTSPFILRRLKKDVLSELPPKTETVHYITLDEAQRKLYTAYAWDVKRKLESATDRDKIEILSMLLRLRQLCCDPALFVDNYAGESAKLDECARMVNALIESGHTALIFSQFTSMLARISERLDAEGVDHFVLQGDTPREERADLVKRFNAGEAPVFLISLKAGGTGLNLTGADTVIHFDPWWNIAAQNQATDRSYRIGQTRSVQVYRLIAKDTIEENILKMQSAKQLLADTVMDAADGGIMSMSKADLLELLE